VHHGRFRNLSLIYFDHVRCHRASIRECVAVNSRHAVGHVLIHVVDTRDVGVVIGDIRGVVVYHRGVVNVGHLGYVHLRIGDVHIVDVAPTGPIRRNVNFPRRQWEPGDASSEPSSTNERN
jgi:hydrogenase maturation factor HypE